MRCVHILIVAAASAFSTSACNRPEPAEPAREESRPDPAAEMQRKRDDESAQLEKRIADLEARWTTMEAKIAEKTVTATAALRTEVNEDMTNVRTAVSDLKTTTPANWWERYERAIERTTEDIEEDVRRFAKGPKPAPERKAEPAASDAPFQSQRDQFVARLRTRADAMEAQLKGVRARGAQEIELEDTRARINKLKDDLDRLGKASADDWWEISAKRVNEYLDRLEDSIGRLDDTKR